MVEYLTGDRIIEYNMLALATFKATKKDKHEVLNKPRLSDVLRVCEEDAGDIFDKAVVLLHGLVKAHAFASGNRRTAFIATKEFLKINKAHIAIKDDPSQANVLRGIREGFYTANEIKEWLKHGTIKEFKR